MVGAGGLLVGHHPIPPRQRGHSPAFGCQTGGGPATGRELQGIILAALATSASAQCSGPKHR